jgi:protein MPE1
MAMTLTLQYSTRIPTKVGYFIDSHDSLANTVPLEYDDDTTIIPRSTSIVAKRLPPARANRGSAARYVSGKMPVTAKNSSRLEKASSSTATASGPGQNGNALLEMNNAQTEEEKIAAMFRAGAEQWDQQKKEMAK